MKKKIFLFTIFIFLLSFGTGWIIHPKTSLLASKPIKSFTQNNTQSKSDFLEYLRRKDRMGDIRSRSPKRFNYVFSIETDPVKKLEIPSNLSNISSPQFSTKGDKLIFSAETNNKKNIWIIDIDGNNLKQLTNDGTGNITPSWMLKSDKVLYASNKTGTYEIWNMNSDGTEKKQLTDDKNYDKSNPKCSPILWRNYHWAKKTGYAILYQAENDTISDIWLMSENGALPSNITEGFGNTGKCINPEWSPHGFTVTYNLEKEGEVNISEGWYHAYYYRRRGNTRHILQNTSHASFPQYLPNQTKLSFIRNGKLYYASVDGNDVKPLQLYGTVKGNYDWSIDGLSLAYVAGVDGREYLCVQKITYPLQEVSNTWLYNDLNGPQTGALMQNRFVVTGKEHKLFHWLYERYARYSYPSPYPLFITTDSILEIYHLFFDYTLRTLEEKKLLPLLEQFVCSLSEELNTLLSDNNNSPELQSDSEKLYAYIKTAELLLNPSLQLKNAPLAKMIREEAGLIREHTSTANSPVFNQITDYTVYTIRGHYTKNDSLGRYFQAMTLLGIPRFHCEIPTEDNIETIAGETRQALILTHLIQSSSRLTEIWEKLYNPILLFVGGADDLTVPDFAGNMSRIYTGSSIKEFYDKQKLRHFLNLIKKEKAPSIGSPEEGKSFRLFPRRFTPDGYIHQELLYPKVGTDAKPRLLPKGMDIMAVLGSEQAYRILDNVMFETRYNNYNAQYVKLKNEFSGLPAATWRQNIYWGWLHTLKSLLPVYDDKYPEFMRNAAWRDKCLFTALASWTELRHDTILYVKQFAAEAGEGGEGWEPVIPKPKSYVEPNHEFFIRMERLIEMSYSSLVQKNLLDKELEAKIMKFKGIVGQLKTIAEKELSGEMITEREYNFLRRYGSEIEYLTIFFLSESLHYISEGSISLIADIGNDKLNNLYLHEAVGKVREINVIVEIDGKKQMNKGGIFTYYEFPVKGKRLNDDDWKKMLDSGKAPALPEWTKSFIVEGN